MLSPLRQAAFQRSAMVLAGLLTCMACLQAYGLFQSARERRRVVLTMGREETRRVAGAIDSLLRTMEREVRKVAEELSSGDVPDQALQGRLEQGLAAIPDAFRMGIDYQPYARDPRKALFSIDVVREHGAVRAYRESSTVDYPTQNWFQADLATEGWHEPHLSRTTFQVVNGYSLYIRQPGHPERPPLGIVRMDLSPDAIRQILATASLGRTGYNCLLSRKGTFLAHPRQDWVTEERNLFQVAQENGDEALWRCGELALKVGRGEVETVSDTGGQPVMLFSEPIPAARWTLESAVFLEEAALSPGAMRQGLMGITCTVMALAACLGLAGMGAAAGTLEALWRWTGLGSLLLAAGVSLLWGLTLAYPDPPSDAAVPILSPALLEKYLASRTPDSNAPPGSGPIRVPTGLYLRTLRFDSANDVVVTGLVWQHYPAEYPLELGRGFAFPNAETQEVAEVFRRPEAKGELVEYTFKATLREDFDRAVKFPFDQAVIRLPLWPREFDRQVTLVPDLEAYNVLHPAALPGVEKGLVLPGWNKERSYFGFLDPAYGTTFGSAGRSGGGRPPELSFQLTLSRQFLDPFVSALLPVIVVGCLLYTLLMVGTKDEEKVRATGFQAIAILPAAGTLLFPVIYAQISLRSRIASSKLLYLEYFYFVMYAVILLVAANALAFTLGRNGLINRQDNALAKLLYWPVVLGTFFMISLVFLY